MSIKLPNSLPFRALRLRRTQLLYPPTQVQKLLQEVSCNFQRHWSQEGAWSQTLWRIDSVEKLLELDQVVRDFRKKNESKLWVVHEQPRLLSHNGIFLRPCHPRTLSKSRTNALLFSVEINLLQKIGFFQLLAHSLAPSSSVSVHR